MDSVGLLLGVFVGTALGRDESVGFVLGDAVGCAEGTGLRNTNSLQKSHATGQAA